MLDVTAPGNHVLVLSTKERNKLGDEFTDMFCKADDTTPRGSYSGKEIERKFPAISKLYHLTRTCHETT